MAQLRIARSCKMRRRSESPAAMRIGTRLFGIAQLRGFNLCADLINHRATIDIPGSADFCYFAALHAHRNV
jgi:hypothetical protein